jgi:hypothetical protein
LETAEADEEKATVTALLLVSALEEAEYFSLLHDPNYQNTLQIIF